MGDPAGVGPDITLAAWHARQQHALQPFVVYANAKLLAERARRLCIDVPVQLVAHPAEASSVFEAALPVIDLALAASVMPGTPDTLNGAAVLDAISRVVIDQQAGAISAIVTNPIAKSVLYDAGLTHPGHTELLGSLAARHWPGHDTPPVMMLASHHLRVVPLTIHVPLRDVPGLISEDLIVATVRTVASSLQRDFGVVRPRIAVAGLNPHAGERGSIGVEDRDIIAPAIARLSNEGLAITGPHSADTLFHEAARQSYDAVVAMYHDQALIPIKTLAFDSGVNVTLGLPFVRTSPDHGTAFDIAGTGRASPVSLIEAIKLAAALSSKRQMAL